MDGWMDWMDPAEKPCPLRAPAVLIRQQNRMEMTEIRNKKIKTESRNGTAETDISRIFGK